MPIWIRNFTYKKIEVHYIKQKPKEDSIVDTTEKFKKMNGDSPTVSHAQFKQFNFKKQTRQRQSKK